MYLEFEDDSVEVVVEGNKILLCEILNNLIDNAICYCPAGAHITIRVSNTSSNCAFLEVTDSDPGIPEEHRGEVFDRFFRLDPESGRGYGLGLAIVKEIVSVHYGEIRLDTPQTGTDLVVRIELPQYQMERAAMSQAVTQGTPVRSSSTN